MNNLPREKLSRLIGQYGSSLCDDPRRCEGLLRDLCGEYKREINLLISAMKEQVPANLLSSKGSIPWESLLNRLTRRLQDNLGLTEEAASWTVESWALALGVIGSNEITPPKPAVGTQLGAALQASSWGKPQIQWGQKKWVIGGALLVCLAIGVGVLLNARKPQQISAPPPPVITPPEVTPMPPLQPQGTIPLITVVTKIEPSESGDGAVIYTKEGTYYLYMWEGGKVDDKKLRIGDILMKSQEKKIPIKIIIGDDKYLIKDAYFSDRPDIKEKPADPSSTVMTPQRPAVGQNKFDVGKKWHIDWQSLFHYKGYLIITEKRDSNNFFGKITVTYKGKIASQDALIIIDGNKVVIRCSNPTVQGWDTDDFYFEMKDDTMIGYSLDKRGRRGSAVFSLLEEQKELTIGDSDELFEQGRLLFKEGRFSEAIEKLEASLRLNPQRAWGHYILAHSYSNDNRDLDAVESFKRAILIKPDYGLAYSGMAWTYNRLGRYNEAVEAAQKAIRLLPNFSDAHYNLAMAYQGLGQRELAKQQYLIVKALKPDQAKQLLEKMTESVKP